MATSIPPNPLKPTQRIVTGHSAEGKAIIIWDDELERIPVGPGVEDAVKTTVWVEKETPVKNSVERVDRKDIVPDRFNLAQTGGSHFIIFDVAPGGGSPTHRLNSLDYGILLAGEITLLLDDGLERRLTEPGTVVVQRGNIHQWINRGNTWSRIAFVLIDAVPVQVKNAEGKAVDLPEIFEGGNCDATQAQK
ncbi:uncharacterized protein EI90DRAFT_3153066 [Cantharellus anzutake]|uniref:uncharacterized protein n=1 Tax=Cantharellus anzutake TaxID=1750568 RepID=UPI001904C50B|nr:uncharacterized protein EI90DRAFT_3291675 [Cantharellus anzutake]XP_038918287.1 uncharacterized protein EI90DRAFT_3153066 [Cantharellus anzutake]KAF8325630.1 hypothetical protein EI90DRAFT_3291675 [Cantharellus anzutake]KAF8334859.1 hypothetical protein EI90DRAFT_3153066 [Cantharellus anzutake]